MHIAAMASNDQNFPPKEETLWNFISPDVMLI
jgi:hypothetical protein